MSRRASVVAFAMGASSCFVLLAYTACVGDSPVAPGGVEAGTDASGNDTGTPDSPNDAAVDAGVSCDLQKAFAKPVAVTELNTAAAEESARISPDGRELFLTRQETNQDKRIYRFTRTSPQATWLLDAVQPTLSVALPADAGASSPVSRALSLSPDAKTAYLSVSRGGSSQIYFSERTGIGQPWSSAAPVTGLASAYSDDSPWFNGAGDRLYFTSFHGVSTRIYTSAKGPNGFAAAYPIGDIRSWGDTSPVLSPDELTIYFGTVELVGDAGAASMNIFTARRAAVGDPFTQSAPVIELDAPGAASYPSWISPDGCEIYFTSNRGGSSDIYSARKPN